MLGDVAARRPAESADVCLRLGATAQTGDRRSFANIADAAVGTFEIVSLENDRHGYARTCKEWVDRLRGKRSQAVALVGEAGYERYQRYLNYAFLGFASGNLDLYRVTLQRNKRRAASKS